MKVVNYNYGYMPTFSCSIHGKIVASHDEWKKAVKYLSHPKVKGTYLDKRILREDLQQTMKTRKGFAVNIRVSATEKVAKKFGFTVKRANYMFEIV